MEQALAEARQKSNAQQQKAATPPAQPPQELSVQQDDDTDEIFIDLHGNLRYKSDDQDEKPA